MSVKKHGFIFCIRMMCIVLLTCGAFFLTWFNVSYVDVPQKQYRYLLMMSSFKRPIFATGQVYRLMNQTYQNFDLSVSLKGVDEKYSRLTFEKELWPYIDQKRLFLKYDWFCKIDDDDWYAPEYLENVNDELNDALKEGLFVDFTQTHEAYILTENVLSTIMYYNNTELTGPTMCFSKKVIKMALEIEADYSLYKKYLPEEPEGLEYVREDRMLSHLAAYWGETKERRTSEPLVIYGQQYRSVIRNQNYVEMSYDSVPKKRNRRLGYENNVNIVND